MMSAKGVAVVTEIDREGQGLERGIGGLLFQQSEGSAYRTPQNHDII